MINLNIYLLLFLLLFNAGCTNSGQKEKIMPDKEPVYAIDLEDCLSTQKLLKLSDIADTIEYMPLKTALSHVVVAWDVKCSKEYMFIQQGPGVYQFTKDGEFIRGISNSGQGPEEYNCFMGYSIDENKQEVAIVDSKKVLFYSFDGSFLRSIKYDGFTNLVQTDTFCYAAGQVYGREKYLLTMLNCSLDTIGGIPNTHFYEPGEGYAFMTSMRGRDPFYTYNGQAYFKGFEDNDTIWRLDGLDYKMHAYVDMGKFKSPQESSIFERSSNFKKKLGDFYCVPRVLEDKCYIYLQCNCYYNPEMKNPRIIFEKERQSGFVVKDESETYGIVDDIAGGPTFWPFLITDDYYMSIIEPVDLLEQRENLANPSPAFKKFLKTIDEDKSNSIIIRAKRKKM